jgi:hypothetical protein
MNSAPIVIAASNISYAWARAFDLSMEAGDELSQLVVSVSIRPDGPYEDVAIRSMIDQHYQGHPKKKGQRRQLCDTVAKTVFPHTLVRPGQNRAQLYETFLKILPQLKKCPANRRGMYFERMISYSPAWAPSSDAPKGEMPDDLDEGADDDLSGEKDDAGSPVRLQQFEPVNQLEKVISDIAGARPRRSGLQLAIFDPTRDHRSNPYLSFPCLQQVSFLPHADQGLSLMALYPMHWLYERAYGNYLGLVRLGEYVASQVGRTFTRITCIAATAKRELTKADCVHLRASVIAHIDQLGGLDAVTTVHRV